MVKSSTVNKTLTMFSVLRSLVPDVSWCICCYSTSYEVYLCFVWYFADPRCSPDY